jgi:hypothetical protein
MLGPPKHWPVTLLLKVAEQQPHPLPDVIQRRRLPPQCCLEFWWCRCVVCDVLQKRLAQLLLQHCQAPCGWRNLHSHLVAACHVGLAAWQGTAQTWGAWCGVMG